MRLINIGIVIATLASAELVAAQVAPENATGLSPYAAYVSSDIDNVNPINGNLFLKIPLVSFPQKGGKLRLDYYIYYNDKSWQVAAASLGPGQTAQYLSWQPGISTTHLNVLGSPNHGGAYGYGNTLGAYVTRDQYAEYSIDAYNSTFNPPTGNGGVIISATDAIWDTYAMTPDGEKHYVSDEVGQQCGGSSPNSPCQNFVSVNRYPAMDASGFDQNGHDGTGVYYANPNVTAPVPPVPGTLTPPNNSGVFTLIDPSGNSIVPNSTGLTDTYGRNIPGTQAGPGLLTFPFLSTDYEFGNYASHDVIPGLQVGSVPSQCPSGTSVAREWDVPGSQSYNSGTATYYLCYTYLSFQTAFNADQVLQNANQPVPTALNGQNIQVAEADSNGPYGQALMLTAIVLPDGNSYGFQYDNFLSLQKLSLPTGATISYTWQQVLFKPNFEGISRALQTRTLDPGYGQPPSTTTYQFYYPIINQQNQYPAYSVITDAYQNDTEYILGGNDDLGNNWQYPFITSISSYAGCSPHHSACSSGNGTLVKAETYGLTSYGGGGFGQAIQTLYTAPFTKVIETTTHIPSIAGIQLSRTVSTLVPNYGTCVVNNYFLNPFMMPVPPATVQNCYQTGQIANIATYDWGLPGSGTPGALLKTQNTSYAWQSSGSILAANMMNLPGSSSTTDSGGAWTSESDLCYDNFGNNTSIQRFLSQPTSRSCANPPTSAILTSSTYTSQGVQSSATDANGNPTTYSNFACNGALPQNVTVGGNNGTVQQTTQYTFDCNTAKVLSKTTPDTAATGYVYSDPLSRLTSIGYPDGGSIQINYNGDVLPLTMTVTTATGEAAGPTIVTKMYDGLARVTSTQQQITSTQTPNESITTQTGYDALGRVAFVTNPYQSSADSTYGITSYAYDSLGRTIYQCQPDNLAVPSASCSPSASYLQWVYDGNSVTAADESGNQWRRTSDALGRLTTVLEPNGASTTPSMETDYSYTALGDLKSVTQWGGAANSTANPVVRSFSYDAMSRLLVSNNPESGVICYGSGDGTLSGCNANGYDPNGNLIYKTDARGVQTNYVYDGLNRLTNKTYTGAGSLASSIVANSQPVTYTYGEPGVTTVPYGVGRMVSESTGPNSSPVTARNILSYDAMGRITSLQQCFPYPCSGTASQIAYAYDLAGNVTSTTNGLQTPAITLSSTYDSAGRLDLLTSSWSDATTHPATLWQASSYGPAGLTGGVLGYLPQTQQSTVNLSRTYDNRLRPTSEVDTGLVNNVRSGSSGSITVQGLESQGMTSGTPATGTITITGTEGSSTCPPNTPQCQIIYDGGTIAVYINGFEATVSFGENSTDASIASDLASAFGTTSNPVGGSPVTAIASGGVVTLTSIASGTQANYSFSIATSGSTDFTATPSGPLVGGTNPVLVYDFGLLSVSVNGYVATVPWHAGSTIPQILGQLAQSLQSSGLVNASVSGSSIVLTSTSSGAATNWQVACSGRDLQNLPPSFSISCNGMTGGADGGLVNAPLYSYLIPPSTANAGYAPNGNLLSMADSVVGSWSYGYDSLNRLTQASALSGTYQGMNISGATLGWIYDSFGNRTLQNSNTIGLFPTGSIQYSVAGNNQATGLGLASNPGISVTSLQYDASGHQTGQNGNVNSLYDAEGKLCATGNAGGGYTQYVYDAEGDRVGKGSVSSLSCVPGNQWTSVYVLGAGGEQLSELGAGGAWVHSNVFAEGSLLATYSGTETYFALNDWLGTKRVEVTPDGQSATYASLPYGDGLTTSGNAGDATEHHFTGKERDTESGLDYFGARYYGSSMGRFTSPDPVVITTERLLNPQQLNLYAYVANNPLRYIDPTGEILQCVGDAKSQSQCFSDLQQIAGDAKDRLSMDAKTGVVSFDTKDLDLSKNEGASLVNDLVGSKNTYDFSVGPTIMTDKGPVRVDHIGNDMANLPAFGDQRQIGNPPAGVSDILDIYFNNPNMTRVSKTNLGVAPEWTVVFHELAEAYEKIDGGKGGSYAAGHNAAVQRETTLRDQRPYLKQYNTGAGGPANSPNPQGGIIIKK